MSTRFKVESHQNVFEVIDTHFELYHQPKRAVTLYFHDKLDADEMCRIMNKVWSEFLVNNNLGERR